MERPDYESATGVHGELADQMRVVANDVWGSDWVGGMEHHIWELYLHALGGPRPSPGSPGSRLVAVGALAVAAGGLWIWPMAEDAPRWASLAEFEGRHAEWKARRAALD